MTTPCCGLAVICCGFISHLIGRETINIPEIFSGVHGFTGKTVKLLKCAFISTQTFEANVSQLFLLDLFLILSFLPKETVK